MEKSIIHKLTIGLISIILSIIVIAVQINVIKTAIELDRTPPVYLLQTYTVILAAALISYLVYFSISQGVDVYRGIDEYKRAVTYRKYVDSKVSEVIDKHKEAKQAIPNPIDNTIDEYDRHKIQVSEVNPIDLKFEPLEDNAKRVLENLKKRRDVQK